MPFRKYLVLRKAVEVAEIDQRLRFISDTNTAFSAGDGGKAHVDGLKRVREMILGGPEVITMEEAAARAPKDPNWAAKLKKYVR